MDILHFTDWLWIYRRGSWDGRPVLRSGDEYGRHTLAFRLPGHRTLVWAYRTCTKHPECVGARAQTLQQETDLRLVCHFYGVTEEQAWDLPGDAWNVALGGEA